MEADSPTIIMPIAWYAKAVGAILMERWFSASQILRGVWIFRLACPIIML